MIGFAAAMMLTNFSSAQSNIWLDNLEVNRMENPIGLDSTRPFFGWQMKSNLTNPADIHQTSYEIIVKDSNGNILWDSGRISDGKSQNIIYSGRNLKPETRYIWNLRVWDQDGNLTESTSTFETGLDGNWSGAKWIGSNDLPLDSHSLSVFKISGKVQILEGSTQAGIVFGANDQRLMDSTKNLWHISSPKDQSRIEIVLDVSKFPAKLKIYRHGYHPEDSSKPMAEFELKSINESNAHKFHEIRVASNHGILKLGIDNEEIELPQVNFWSKGFVVNPAGDGGDYVSFPVVGDIGFVTEKNQCAKFKDLIVRNYREPSNILFDSSKSKILPNKILVGELVIVNPSHGSMPILKTNFKLKNKKIDQARIYATARGIYDLELNGERVSDDYFAPGLAQYDKHQLYQTYDVTKFLRAGENELQSQLSEGWWSGAITFQGSNWNYFGDRQSLLAKLVVNYEDGSQQIIVTEPKSWHYSDESPLIYGSFFQGETLDLRRESIGNWQKSQEIPLDSTTTFLGISKHPTTQVERQISYADQKIIGQEGSSVHEVERVKAISSKKIADRVFVYDLGQNLAGVPNIKIENGIAGQKITLRFAEMVYPDSGELMLENIRGALSTDNFILKNGSQTLAPRNTQHGFRYIEITGIDELPLESVGAMALSSVDDWTADFECSDPNVNRLFRNIQWSTRANFLSIPTDCPQRNERMGWSGDLSVFAPTASYLWNTDRFLARHMQALRDLQDPSGRFADIAPIGGGFGGMLWGSVGITVPWEIYQQYGDSEVLRDHYESMKRYIEFIRSKYDCEKNLTQEFMELGDWLSPENSKNDVGYLLTAQEIWNLDTMSKIAEVLGESNDASYFKSLYDERKRFFNDKFFDPESHRSLKSDGSLMDTQTSYAVAIGLDILDDSNKDRAAKYLVETVERENIDDTESVRPKYSLMTGFIGTARISQALSKIGRSDLAYKMLENHEYPSWLYPVDQGATTIWERLNSYTRDGGFGGNNSMNSFNHYSFGAVGAWMFSDSLGISRDENSPGWKHFILKPEPDFNGKISWARGFFDSPYGRISSSWKILDSSVEYEFDVPPNTSADCQLMIPNQKSRVEVSINGESQNLRVQNDHVNLNLIPGHWKIIVKN